MNSLRVSLAHGLCSLCVGEPLALTGKAGEMRQDTRLQSCSDQCFSFSLLFPSGRGGRRCPAVRLSPSQLTWLFFVPADKGENGEPYQRRKGAGPSLPDSPPAFPAARDGAPTAGSSSWRRIMLMILAITIHNIPGKPRLSVHPSQLLDSLFLGSMPSWRIMQGWHLLPLLLSPAAHRWHWLRGSWVPFDEGYHVRSCSLGTAEPRTFLAAKPCMGRGLGGSPWARARCRVLNICSLARYCQPVVGENCKPESRLRRMPLCTQQMVVSLHFSSGL